MSFTLKLWNSLTIKWNDQAWNDLTMERCDLKPEFLCLFLRSHFAGKPVEATTPPMPKIFHVKGELMIIKHDRRFHKWPEKTADDADIGFPASDLEERAQIWVLLLIG